MGTNRSNKLNKKNKSNIFSVLFLIVLIGIIIFLLNKIFLVKKVTCRQNDQACTQSTLDKIDHFKNKSLFFTNFDDELNQFSDYKISKRLPSELIIELSNVQSNYFGIDENNKFVIVENDQLSKEINQIANQIHTALNQQEIEFKSIELNNDVLIIELDKNLRALIDSIEVESGVTKLKLIQSNLSLKEIDTGIKEIDTRFKMPVLKTKLSDI